LARKSNIGPLPPARRKRPPRKPVFKKYSRQPTKPPFRISELLKWADAHRQRTGRWPITRSGPIHEAPWDTWAAVDNALGRGIRGCRPGGSLAKLLLKYRGKKPRFGAKRRPRITTQEVLAWADIYHERTGCWPAAETPDPVPNQHHDTWRALNGALYKGTRGLPGRDSLAQLLKRERGVERTSLRSGLTIKQILAWADAFHARHGGWPSFASGAVDGAPGENWLAIHCALEKRSRGLPSGYSLATLLAKYRGRRYHSDLPKFSIGQILAWADDYQRRQARWPTLDSGPIPQAPGEYWSTVHTALSRGGRSLPGGDTLARLLTRTGRGPRDHGTQDRPRRTRLSVRQILAWADVFRAAHGRWPGLRLGPIDGVPGETWASVNRALRSGSRGLTGGSSLALLLREHRGCPRGGHRRPLTATEILRWADACFRRSGKWPSGCPRPIPESPGDTWKDIDAALRNGYRGLPGGDSIPRLLARNGRGRSSIPPRVSARPHTWRCRSFRPPLTQVAQFGD
jgi:hypothetical protein